MAIFYHGSPCLFEKFDLSTAGDGTGIRFGFGVYLTEVEKSAVHYSQPRKCDLCPKHYLYTVEIPELTDDNHLTSALPVSESIVARVEEALGVKAPEAKKAKGLEFRKWVGYMLTGAKKNGFAEEKKAAKKNGKTSTQVRLVPKNGKGNVKGNRTTVDGLKKNKDGTFTIIESKASKNPKLSKGQKASREHVTKGNQTFEVRSYVPEFNLQPNEKIAVSNYITVFKK